MENVLLADIIAIRDECRIAQRLLAPADDPTGDARLAYGVCADQLAALIERHTKKTPNPEIQATEKMGDSMGRPDCNECKWCSDMPGDMHKTCQNPKEADDLQIKGNPHGVRHGWFRWPWNFDPVWLENCNGFVSIHAPARGATKGHL